MNNDEVTVLRCMGLVAVLAGTAVAAKLALSVKAKKRPDPQLWLGTSVASTAAAWALGVAVPMAYGRGPGASEELMYACIFAGLLPFALTYPIIRPAMEKTRPLIVRQVRAVMGLVAGVFAGLMASQHFPLFGGFAIHGAPWSAARESLINGHIAFFSILCAVVGYVSSRGRGRAVKLKKKRVAPKVVTGEAL